MAATKGQMLSFISERGVRELGLFSIPMGGLHVRNKWRVRELTLFSTPSVV